MSLSIPNFQKQLILFASEKHLRISFVFHNPFLKEK